jgi:hypothetical protein
VPIPTMPTDSPDVLGLNIPVDPTNEMDTMDQANRSMDMPGTYTPQLVENQTPPPGAPAPSEMETTAAVYDQQLTDGVKAQMAQSPGTAAAAQPGQYPATGGGGSASTPGPHQPETAPSKPGSGGRGSANGRCFL